MRGSEVLRSLPVAVAILCSSWFSACATESSEGSVDATGHRDAGATSAFPSESPATDGGASSESMASPAPDSVIAEPGAVRRLSNHELVETYKSLFGALDSVQFGPFPPNQRDFTFDRVAESQTITERHLEAFERVAVAVAEAVLAERRLDDLSERCSDDATPPASMSKETQVFGSALAADPLWAVTTEEQLLHFLYAPEASVGATLAVHSPGIYRLELSLQTQAAARADLVVDGESVQSFTVVEGGDTLSATFEFQDPGSHRVEYFLRDADDGTSWNNRRATIQSLAFTGPIDEPTDVTVQERLGCAEDLVESFAARVYRRPLTADERSRLLETYTQGVESQGASAGFKMLFEAMLSSPYFLYLVETGDAADGHLLTALELANRLSYSLCSTPPDEPLRELAVSGELLQRDVLASEIERLSQAPCARATLLRFFEQWLELSPVESLMRDPERFPEFNSGLGPAMLSETRRFLTEMIFSERSGLKDLLLSEESWLGDTQAELYGLSVVSDELLRTALPAERRGLLTQPAVLAATSKFASTSPVHRGVFIMRQVLCQSPPPPPPGIDVTPPALDPEATTRQRWEQHSAQPGCASCHSLFDPIGFALENFDAIGRYRVEENGLPIDARGGLPPLGLPEGSINGPVELVEALAASEQVRDCFSKQLLRYSLGRLPQSADQGVLAAMAASSEGSIQGALSALFESPRFAQRGLNGSEQ